MKNKKLIIMVAVAATLAAVVLGVFLILDLWLPRKVGEAITARFGDDVRVGEVRYLFPLGVEVRDVVFVKKPNFFLSGEAKRARVKLRPSAVFLLRHDMRLFQEASVDGFTIYLYPIRGPRLTMTTSAVKGAVDLPGLPPATLGTTPPAAPPAGGPAANAVGTAPLSPAAKDKKVKPAGRVPYDIVLRGRNGSVVFRQDRGDAIILRDVGFDGRLTDKSFDVDLDGKTEKRGSFSVAVTHSYETKAGSAEYKVEAVEAAHILPLGDKPSYLLEAEGVLSFTGWVKWGHRRLDHRATGRLSHGRLVLQPGPVRFTLEEVTLQFTLHNGALTIDEGSCEAAEVRWRFSGVAAEAAVDLTFHSDNMLLQKLVDLFVGGANLSYAGVGTAEFRIAGTARQPEFYLRVERTDRQ